MLPRENRIKVSAIAIRYFWVYNLNVFNNTDQRAITSAKHPRKILLAGGTGQIGTILARHFHAQGDQVTVLVRHPVAVPWRVALWNGRTLGSWIEALDGSDILINLAGRSVNCRYTAKNRQAIIDSRVESTRILGIATGQCSRPPSLWINASTATIYRHALDRPMDEATGEPGGNEPDAPDTWKFSIEVARRWEAAFFEAAAPQTRKIALRSAMVMSPDRGGIFDTLLRLIRMGLGGKAGNGRQFVSWIHDQDFTRAIEFLVRANLEGCVNVSAPCPLPNAEFMRLLRVAYGRPVGLPATEWMLGIGAFLMRTETELILKSRRVVPGRLLEAGFHFQFPEWPQAAQDLTTRWRSG